MVVVDGDLEASTYVYDPPCHTSLIDALFALICHRVKDALDNRLSTAKNLLSLGPGF